MISFLTASSTTVAGQAIEYDDFTITPVVVPATEEVYTSSTKTDMTAKPIYDATFSDGWIEATIELPTLDATTLKNIYDAGTTGTTNAQYTIFFTNNKSTPHLAFDILTVRNGSTAGATTTLRLDLTAAGYGTRDYSSFSKTLNAAASAAFWDSTKPVTVKLGKVDNFYTLVVSQNGSEVWTCSFAIDETDANIPLKNPDSVWSFGVSGSIGKLYYDTAKTQQITTPAYISNVSVHRINKISSIEVADNAASLVTLPTMNVHQGNSVTRTAFYAGETITLATVIGYDYFANGEKIEDPENFVIPDAETVTITAVEQEVYMPEADMGGSVVAWHESANTTGGVIDTDMWTTSGTSTMVDGAISAGANFKLYTKANSYADGYIEADVTITEGNMESLESGTKYGGNISARWNLSLIEVRPRFQVVKAADGTYTANLQLVGYCNADTDWGSTPHFGPAYAIPNFAMGNTYKVRLTVIGNYIQVKLNGAVVSEWTLDAATDVLASQSGYFGLSHTGDFGVEFDNVVAVSVPANGISVNEDIASYVTLPSRNMYAAGEEVALAVDTEALEIATLKINDGNVQYDLSGNTVTFTMPAEAVTVTCEVKQLAANEEVFTSNTQTSMTTTTWYDAALNDGKITAVLTLPTLDSTTLTNIKTVGTSGTTNPSYNIKLSSNKSAAHLSFDILLNRGSGTTTLRWDITAAGYGARDYQTYSKDLTLAQSAVFWDETKPVTVVFREVDNYYELVVTQDGSEVVRFATVIVADATSSYPLINPDTTWYFGVSGSVGKVYYDTEKATQITTPAYVNSVVVERINKTATVEVADAAADLVSLPSVEVYKGTTTIRTAYQIGETIALNAGESADLATLKANGTVIEDHAAFVIPNAETVTITCDAAALEPFYTNDFSANYDGLTLGSINLDSVECGRFTHTDGQLVITKDAGVDKNAQILATMASHDAVLANGFVTSLDITAYKQKTAEGADTTYPWILFTVNNKIQFRVIPAPTEDAPNRYGFVINNGESAGWVNAEGTGTSGVVWHYIELPGTMNTGTDGGVTYNVAVKLVGNAYTMYINGQQVFAGTTTADLSTNKVTFGGATSGGNTRGFTLKFDNLRIDRIVAPENITFGQKVLALNADMALDFYISTSTTATTATLTLGTNDLGTVTLADAKRAAAIYDVNGDGIAEWSTWYVVTANVPVKDIAKDVTVTLDDNSTYSYSVEDYADYIVNTAGYSESVKKVAQSLLDYGTVAATYFADRSGSATLDAELSSRLDVAAIANTWAPTKTGTNEYISLYGCSLEAVEDANICMYFQLVGDHDWAEDGSNVSVTVNGEAVTNFTVTDAANGYKRVKITGIHAADLDVVYTVTVTSEHGDLTVSYSGLSYAYTAANYSAGSVNLKTLAKALYNYWDAAQNMN